MYEGLDADGEAQQLGVWANHRIYDTACQLGYRGSFNNFERDVRDGAIDIRSVEDVVASNSLDGCVHAAGCATLAFIPGAAILQKVSEVLPPHALGLAILIGTAAVVVKMTYTIHKQETLEARVTGMLERVNTEKGYP